MRINHDYSEGAVLQGLTLQIKVHFSRNVVPAQSAICLCVWVVLWCDLKLVTGSIGSGAYWWHAVPCFLTAIA